MGVNSWSGWGTALRLQCTDEKHFTSVFEGKGRKTTFFRIKEISLKHFKKTFLFPVCFDNVNFFPVFP